MNNSFERGDHVFIGQPSPRKVHWEVVATGVEILTPTRYIIRSPMSGRERRALGHELTLHTKGSPA